ncbi:hypothetical protein GCM10027443_17890 [Pontibacter brevis]
MYNIYQLYLMNEKQLPFEIVRFSWGNLKITLDKIDNIRFSAGAWYCDAYTLSEDYKDFGYGKVGDYKEIGCAGNYSWSYADETKEYNEDLLPKVEKRHDRGLAFQKAGKDYECYHCKKLIPKGQEYERYSVRSAGKKGMPIKEVFCIGHRDEMREKFFGKPADLIEFKELIEVWDKGKVI